MSEEGAMVWAFFDRHQGAVRRGGLDGIVVGLDYVQMFALADAYGLEKRVLVELLPACEAGMLDALAEEAGAARVQDRGAQHQEARA